MADNITLDPGSAGATVKTDDDGSAHWQYVKVSFGADNTQTRVTSSVGLPVDILAGTAEIGNNSDLNHAWIAGYVPWDRPRYAFAVVVHRTSGHGAEVAGPIAARTLEGLPGLSR